MGLQHAGQLNGSAIIGKIGERRGGGRRGVMCLETHEPDCSDEE